MRLISKPVCATHTLFAYECAHCLANPELQALGDDLLEEEEMPSYLKDTTALPDFVDEAPVDATTVSGVLLVMRNDEQG